MYSRCNSINTREQEFTLDFVSFLLKNVPGFKVTEFTSDLKLQEKI